MAARGDDGGEARRVDCGRLLCAGEGDADSRSRVKGLFLAGGRGPLRFAIDMTGGPRRQSDLTNIVEV